MATKQTTGSKAKSTSKKPASMTARTVKAKSSRGKAATKAAARKRPARAVDGDAKGNMFTRADLKSRGWTDGMTKRLLGGPDSTKESGRNGFPAAHLYDRQRVLNVEETSEFQDALGKAKNRNGALSRSMEERDYPDVVSRSALKKWGWTDTLIDRYLGDPDELGNNPISPSGPDVKYYKKERIQEIERRSEVKEALGKVRERRNGSALGTDRKTSSRTSSPKRGKTSQRGTRDSIAHRIGAASGKRLVIVESPAKARTVGQILGRRYVVTASQGHVRDLPRARWAWIWKRTLSLPM